MDKLTPARTVCLPLSGLPTANAWFGSQACIRSRFLSAHHALPHLYRLARSCTIGMESKARDPNEQARKRLKVLGGTGLATNRSQLKRVLDVLKELPTVDLQEALGSTTWDLDQAVRLL